MRIHGMDAAYSPPSAAMTPPELREARATGHGSVVHLHSWPPVARSWRLVRCHCETRYNTYSTGHPWQFAPPQAQQQCIQAPW